MGSRRDISDVLTEWATDDPAVRIVTGEDGRPKIQRRVPLGILQLEFYGRPDGQNPFGCASYLEYLRRELTAGRLDAGLRSEQCQELAEEALLYYHRRLCFFELGEFRAAANDARRNLAACDFAKEFAADPDDAWVLEQYRPYIIFHRVRGDGLDAMEQGRIGDALAAIESGLAEIADFYIENNLRDHLATNDEWRSLQGWKEELQELHPKDPRERLLAEMRRAIAREDYERAAKIRDELQGLFSSPPVDPRQSSSEGHS